MKKKNRKSSIVNNQSAAERPKAPEIIVRKSVRGVTRREAFDKAQVGFDARYKKKWVEKVGWSRRYEEGWELIFGKKAV